MTTIPQKKIAVAMSGGVDSSVAAALLKEAGAAVVGVFMKLAQPDLAAQIARVRELAGFLGIPLEIIDLGAAFKREVLDYFARAYLAGRTPNPCIVCNRLIKCGLLLETVRRDLGATSLATGHYARITRDSAGKSHLLKGRDSQKDQSYFLGWLSQEQLRWLLFPLGEMRKEEVRAEAERLGLGGRHGEESQDVCFLQDQSLPDFLRFYQSGGDGAGPIITTDGRVVGRHQGIHAFTVGQRRGLGIPDRTPYYVVRLDPRQNAVVVGKEEELRQSLLEIREVNWLAGESPPLPAEYEVKIRYRHPPARARVENLGAGAVRVLFDLPQRAVTPGQFAVLYQGDEVIASGEIVRSSSR